MSIIHIIRRPFPKPRPRIYNGKGVKDKREVLELKEVIPILKSEYISKRYNKDANLKINFCFSYKIPISYTKKQRDDAISYKKRPKVADIDNLIKFYLDAMHSIVYDDDRCVVSVTANKIYSLADFVIIEITEAV